jgi:hypothetical protein
MGGRESSYDYFPDTDLSDPALLGRPAILVGSAFDRWRQSLCFSSIKRTPLAGRVFAAQDYAGPAEKP